MKQTILHVGLDVDDITVKARASNADFRIMPHRFQDRVSPTVFQDVPVHTQHSENVFLR